MVMLVRLLHGAISGFFIACIAIVYYSGVTGRRSRLLYPAIAALAVEGAIVLGNNGKCPLGRVHNRYGDDREFFELFMPRRLSRHAVPALTVVTVVGVAWALWPRRRIA
jgi:cbb3-type cytochrome oxidase subunit 3